MRYFFILMLLLCGLMTSQSLLAAPQFRIAYPSHENVPRATGRGLDVPAELPGITVELMRMVGKRAGVEIGFVRAPWRRCLYLLEHGVVDAVFHASYKAERAEYGVYPQNDGQLDKARAIYVNRYVVYVRRQDAVAWDGERFTDTSQPLGAMLGAAGAADLRKLGYEVEEELNAQINFDKLHAGRIAAYVEIETIGDSFLKPRANRYSDIVKLPVPFSEKVYYLLIAKPFYRKRPELSEAIFDAIRDVQQQDGYRAMVKKYP